ncbi:MAG: TIGR00153 family protein [Hadesarchaea archaeon]|nr:TIGR00153 family protein [Hadesarchaea archaeon]
MKEILMIGISPIGGGKEKEALEILRKNARNVMDTVKKFEEMMIALFSERNVKKAQALGRQVSELETKADGGRRKFTCELSRGAFLPAFRGDLARLAERLDSVADTAEGVAREIVLREKLFDAISKAEKKQKKTKTLREGMVKMARLATQTAEALRGAVDLLVTNIDATKGKINEVEKLEHETDLLEQSLLGDLYEYEKFLDPVSVAQLGVLIRGIGDISDRAEDTGDVLSIIGYTLRA